MASNQEEAIKTALGAGDTNAARQAYDKYAQSMGNAGQTPKPQEYFGIPKY